MRTVASLALIGLGAWVGASATFAAAWIAYHEAWYRRHNQHLTELADLFSDDDDTTRVHFELWERGL